jgi:dihydroorotase
MNTESSSGGLHRILIKGGHVIDPACGRSEKADVLISGGIIEAIDKPDAIPTDSAEVVDASGQYVAPGFVDMHVHLREPGYEYKETVATGCMSAVVGGVTSVACMANTSPINDNGAVTNYIIEKANMAGLANVFPVGALSVGLAGESLAEFGEMFEAGIVAVSDDGHPVMKPSLMRHALEYAKMFGIPVLAHEEDLDLCCGGVMNEGLMSIRLGLEGIPSVGESAMVARDIELARYTGGRLHIAHVSTAESVEMVRRAKNDGLDVTCEATPHHFTLDDSAVDGYNTNAKMYPPLRTVRDVAAVREGLADGSVDSIATDHAPHHRDEKASHFDEAAKGIVGLETALPLSMALVLDNVINIERMVDALSTQPARNLGLERGTLARGAVADVVVFDTRRRWNVVATELASKSKNTPFDGWEVQGKVTRTIVAGRSVWEDSA